MGSLIVMKKRETCAQSSASPQKKCAAMQTEAGSMWANMAPEVLANIFCRLPLKQLLCFIPCVCKSWLHASLDPLCWQVLDLSELPFQAPHGLVQVFLHRTEGHIREFVFPYMNHPDWLKIIENSAPVLQKLHIPHTSCAGYLEKWAINVAPLMTHLTDLDLSNIRGILLSHEALEAFGKHCRHITHLRRNEDDLRFRWQSAYPSIEDSAAFAIARNYPSVKHLELRCNLISTEGLRALLDGCLMLEHLDLTASVLDMDEPFLRECRTRLRVFLKPYSTDEVSDDEDSDDDEDDDDSDVIRPCYHDGCGVCQRYVEMNNSSNESDDSSGLDDYYMRRNRGYDDNSDDEYRGQRDNEENEDEDEDEDEGEGEKEEEEEEEDEDEEAGEDEQKK